MSYETRRVVITGIGAVSGFGQGYEALWQGVKNGRSCVKRITRVPTEELTCKVAAEITKFDVSPYIPLRQAAQMDRFCHFGLWAAGQAIEDSGLDMKKEDVFRVGAVTGTGIGGLDHYHIEARNLFEKGPRRVTPFFIPKVISNLLSGWMSILYGFKGYSNTVVTACSTGITAIGESYVFIKAGIADVFITGGAESAVTMLGLAGFCSMKALSTGFNDTPERASRPFDLNRDGFVMGDGAGFFVLEELKHAEKRGAHIYAEIIGYSLTSDAYHITAPDPCGAGAAEAMRLCLKDAKMAPNEIEYINAHGTSTLYNDRTETKAIKEVFGNYAQKVPVSSTKSMHGHGLGAAGGIETAVCLMAMRDGIVPPTINYDTPDPECDLDYVPNVPRKQAIRTVMNNAFAFGGHNAILIFKKYEG